MAYYLVPQLSKDVG